MSYYFEKWKTRSILPYHTSQPSRVSTLSNTNQNYQQTQHLDPYDQNYNYYYNNNNNNNNNNHHRHGYNENDTNDMNDTNDKRKGILYNQEDNEEESTNNNSRKKKVRKTIISMLETMKWYSNRLENERLKNQQLKMELQDEKAMNNLPTPKEVHVKPIQSSSSIHYNEFIPQHQQQQQDYHRPNMYHRQQPLLNRKWIPIFSYLLSLGFCILFVYEMVVYKQNYGIILSLSPFNMMLGPNSEIMVKSGALFSSCIRKGNLFNASSTFNCGSTNAPPPLTPPSWFYFIQPSTSGTCHLQDLCGLTKFSNDGFPDQHYRFITTILVHSGLVQLVINIIVLLTFCASIERKINPLRYAFCWLVSGIFGSVFVSLFLNENIVLTGCFGSVFGIIGLSLIDLFKSWQASPSSNGQSLFKHILLIGN
ncbi:unnamed protein product [Cunninghamella blakesleeana]